MFLWDFVADKVMGQIVDWIYSKLLEFLGEFFGSAITFASAGKQSAPGQIDVDTMRFLIDTLHLL